MMSQMINVFVAIDAHNPMMSLSIVFEPADSIQSYDFAFSYIYIYMHTYMYAYIYIVICIYI